MRKTTLAILVLLVIAGLAAADYFINFSGGIANPLTSSSQNKAAHSPDLAGPPNITQQILDKSGMADQYTIETRTRSTELFENFDLKDVNNLSIFKNTVIRKGVATQYPIYVYEIQGPAGEGSVTYLSLKLAMIKQLGSASGVNETGSFGFNSLFYNDPKFPTIGYLLSQVGDTVFGFKYRKETSEAFDFAKNMINNYMSQISK